ncbi:hypothetical protein K523DRAFT_134729 [Schizophyllum commune Tattone D]|nr:hypothetical protein K523DRAFT_134729 [Schizophyllum commune Tattone D]
MHIRDAYARLSKLRPILELRYPAHRLALLMLSSATARPSMPLLPPRWSRLCLHCLGLFQRSFPCAAPPSVPDHFLLCEGRFVTYLHVGIAHGTQLSRVVARWLSRATSFILSTTVTAHCVRRGSEYWAPGSPLNFLFT